ncbi:Arginine--tRNA ligase [Pichia membranifaciens]|uniref:arginine--tRNA ligase n=1 Tax=Pichia membranifaciens TaxID=4926 RepID=A0A1Q2YCU0_9ASCO|nr:Arginine--tRNA ligase [Pichia membranifaciens]
MYRHLRLKSIGVTSSILSARNSVSKFSRNFSSTYFHSSALNTGTMDTLTESLKKLDLVVPAPVADSFPEANTVDLCRNYITEQLSELAGVDKSIIFPALEWCQVLEKGDLLLPLPRLRLKGNLDETAKDLAAKFPLGGYIDRVVPQGKFLQFYFNTQFLLNYVTKDVLARTLDFGSAPLGNGKSVVVEFSSPNIAKPFHAGHLRSTIIGGFLSNLYEKLGWKVIRMNYLGDWGKQFGVLAVGFRKYGSEAELEVNPIQHLFDVYVKINNDIKTEQEAAEASGETLDPNTCIDGEARSFFKKMEDGDKDSIALWKKFRDLSIEKYIGTYARLNIKYDVYSGESQVSEEVMKDVSKTLEEKKMITEDRGALLIDFKQLGQKKLGKVLVQKSDGTSLYITRDLGAAIERHEKYNFDKMIYVIASQQDLHVKQFFTALDMMGNKWSKDLVHVNFGMVLGMSTRKGTVVFLDDILEAVKAKMLEIMKQNSEKFAQVDDPEKVADLVGISAVMIQDMQAKRINNYEFGWDRMLSSEGDTGPYLQYAHSRLRSIQRSAAVPDEDLLNADMSIENVCGSLEKLKAQNLSEEEFTKKSKLLESQIEKTQALARVMASYPDTLRYASKNYEPSTVVTYLFKLTHQFSSTYKVLRVIGEDQEVMVARLALFSAVRQILHNGMILLGITPVERM